LASFTRRPLLSALAALAVAGPARAETPLAGRWSGVLDVGARLRLRLEIGADGKATLYSLDQGNAAIPLTVRALTPERIDLAAPSVRGRFTGRATAADRIEGTWTQGAPLALVFVRGDVAEAQRSEPLTADRLRGLRVDAGAPALIAAVAKGGAAPTVWVDGERAAGGGVAVTAQDVWHIGSITKSFTATLVARLVEAGRISFDDTVGDVLGAIAPRMRDQYRAVTFRHLLSHCAGLPGNIPTLDLLRFSRLNADPREERKTYARIALGMAPKGPPGATFEYANNGFVVAGAMLEARLGESWEALMRQHVLAPLGISSAGFGPPGPDQPAGHSKRRNGAREPHRPPAVADNPAALGPAGTLHMSVGDLLTYLAAHRDRTDFLKPDSWTTLHTPPFGGDYAMGWIVREDGALWHNGSNTLWYAEATFNPRTGVVAAAATNDGAQEPSLAVARALRGALDAA
jgi:CubicO group peptidase (beta-lactamase class C family)